VLANDGSFRLPEQLGFRRPIGLDNLVCAGYAIGGRTIKQLSGAAVASSTIRPDGIA
jgi:hypothetical protein